MARHGGSLAVTRGATEKKVTWSREFTHLGLLLLPALALLVYLFLLVLPGIDPGRANYQRFAGAYNMIRFSLLSLIAIAYGVVHVWIRGYPNHSSAARPPPQTSRPPSPSSPCPPPPPGGSTWDPGTPKPPPPRPPS